MQATRAGTVQAIRVLRQAAILVGGSLLLAIGAVMLFLPGPGAAIIFAGLALLSTEYAWARRWLDRGKKLVSDVRARVLPRRLQVQPATVSVSSPQAQAA